MKEEKEIVREKVIEERQSLVEQLEGWLETPLLILGFAWLALLVYELIWNLSPALELLGTAIWIIFILEFAVKFTLAPQKINYLKNQLVDRAFVDCSGIKGVSHLSRFSCFAGGTSGTWYSFVSRLDFAESRNEIFGSEFRATRFRLGRRSFGNRRFFCPQQLPNLPK